MASHRDLVLLPIHREKPGFSGHQPGTYAMSKDGRSLIERLLSTIGQSNGALKGQSDIDSLLEDVMLEYRTFGP